MTFPNVAHLTAADQIFAGKARLAGYNKNGYPGRGLELSHSFRQAYGALVARKRNGICTAQAGTASTLLTLNGTSVTGGVATFDAPRVLSFYSASGDETGHTVLVTGTNWYGHSMTELVTLANGSSGPIKVVFGKKAFASVTSILSNSTTTGNIEIGYSNIIGLPFAAIDKTKVLGLPEGVSGVVASPVTISTFITVGSTAETVYLTSPIGGVITKIWGNSNGANATTANVITFTNTSESSYSNVIGTLTQGTSYSAGTLLTGALNAGNKEVAAGDIITMVNGGGGTETKRIDVMIEIDPVVVIAADQTTPATTTTGDNRGTISFGRAPNATLNFSALIFPDHTSNKGAFGVTPV